MPNTNNIPKFIIQLNPIQFQQISQIAQFYGDNHIQTIMEIIDLGTNLKLQQKQQDDIERKKIQNQKTTQYARNHPDPKTTEEKKLKRKIWIENNKDKITEYRKQWRKHNPNKTEFNKLPTEDEFADAT